MCNLGMFELPAWKDYNRTRSIDGEQSVPIVSMDRLPGSCVAFGKDPPNQEVDKVAQLVYALATEERSASLSVLRAVAALEGISDESDVVDLLEGRSDRTISPSPTLRQLLQKMNLTHVPSPVNLMEWGERPNGRTLRSRWRSTLVLLFTLPPNPIRLVICLTRRPARGRARNV